MKSAHALLGAIAAAFLLFISLAPGEQFPTSLSSIENRPMKARALPFTYGHFLSYFEEVFDKPPRQISETSSVFTSGDDPNDSIVITVAETGSGLSVILLATGNSGLSHLREFFEAPFFRLSESKIFYALLEEGNGTRVANLERFKVELSVVETRNWITVTLEFSP